MGNMMMGIASMSMDMKASQLQQTVQTSVLKKSMDAQSQAAMAVIQEMMPQPAAPSAYGFEAYA